MEYELFDMRLRAEPELPFPEVQEGSHLPEECRLAREPALAEEIEEDEIGLLREESCALQYGGWLFLLRPGDDVVHFCERPLGELELPLWHVLERFVLPLYATLRADDRVCLHASGVSLDDHAWLFIGDTGSGKSTTAFELTARHGASLASDEMAVVDVESGELLVGSPGIRLRPEQVESGFAVDSGVIHPALEKRWYRLPNDRLAAGRAPLAGIVALDPVEVERGSGAASPAAARVRGSQRLTRLLDQTFEFEEGTRAWRERRFRNAAALAKSCRFREFQFRLSRDGAPTHVDRLRDLLHDEDPLP